MTYSNITTSNTEFVLFSFEGPDCYSLAGGLGVRMHNLSRTLAQIGFTTHLFYIGDPDLPGEEKLENGKLVLHRWGQWISRFYPGGVYDGEEGKQTDFNDSVPGYVVENIIRPAAAQDKIVAVLAEEWQTAETICRLSDALYNIHLRDKAVLFWNANNTFSFHRINWSRLNLATTITTISRYMKHIMERMGLSPLVIPNGIPRALLRSESNISAEEFKLSLGADVLLCKVARWDPDKRWMEAVEAAARLKDMGLKTTLLARGGKEPYGQEIINRARSLDLTVKRAEVVPVNDSDYYQAIRDAAPADVIDIRFQLPLDFLTVIYRAADAVLANSGHEPFGIVGLEAMAAGGVVLTGSTGEDYAIPFVNSLMIETADPMEIVNYILYLRNYPEHMKRMQRAARITARLFSWEAAVQNLIGKLENQARTQGILSNRLTAQAPDIVPAEMIAGNLARRAPEKDSLRQLMDNRCLSANI